jgi:hypothetical protein
MPSPMWGRRSTHHFDGIGALARRGSATASGQVLGGLLAPHGVQAHAGRQWSVACTKERLHPVSEPIFRVVTAAAQVRRGSVRHTPGLVPDSTSVWAVAAGAGGALVP